MRSFDRVECIGSEVPPKLSTIELHTQFQDPDKDRQLAAVDALLLLQVLQSFLEKDSEMEMEPFLTQILEMELKEFEALQ